MRNRLKAFTIIVVIVLLASLAAWPVMTRNGPPTVGDGLIHFYRLAALDWAVANGVLYPRWLPDMAYGYGLAVFNFYPPLSYWAAEIWRGLGLPLALALQGGYVLAFVTLAGGAFVWARAVFDRSTPAGLAAASAAVLAPYLAFNVVHRGAYPEVWGLALTPWGFWAVWRLAHAPDRWKAVAGLGLVSGLLMLTHALTAFVVLPLLGLYALVLCRGDWRGWLWTAGALLLGAGLGAVFWWPLVWEARFVQLARTTAPGAFGVTDNLLTLRDLLGGPRLYDPRRTFNVMPIGLSWPILLAALWGGWQMRKQPSVWLAAGAAAGLALLTLPLATAVWDTLPLVGFIQFPWRLVGPTSLMLALLAGGAVVSLPARWQIVGVAGLLLTAALFVMPWTFGEPPATLAGRDHADIPAYERATGQLGTTATGEYLTIWTTTLPDASRFETAYAAGALPVTRTPVAGLGPGVLVRSETAGYARVSIDYTAEGPFDATLDWLFFPDVYATVDGERVTVQPNPVTGLVTAPDLPSGAHRLEVWQAPSQSQRVGTVLSGVSALVMLGLGLWSLRGPAPGDAPAEDRLTLTSVALIGLIALGLMGLRWAWLDQAPSPVYASRLIDGGVQGATPQSIDFGDQLRLIGVETTRAGVWLYWQPLADLTTDYSVAVFLEDAQGYRYAQHDSQHPGQVPSSRWRLDQYAADWHPIEPWPGTPPGDYRLMVSVYSAAGALDAIGDGGVPVGQLIDVGAFTLTPDTVSFAAADLQPQVDGRAAIGDPVFDEFVLLGYDIDRPAVNAGGTFYMTLYWQAQTATPAGTRLSLGLRAAGDDQIIEVVDAPLTTRQIDWRAGDVGRGPQRLAVPADVPAGLAEIVLTLAGRSVSLGTIEITMP